LELDAREIPVVKSNAVREAIERRAAAGEHIAFAEIDALIASDAEVAAAFRSLAEELRAGRSLSLADVAARTGFTEQFLLAAWMSRLTGSPVVGVHLVHEGSLH
jgi:hypothetical protein